MVSRKVSQSERQVPLGQAKIQVSYRAHSKGQNTSRTSGIKQMQKILSKTQDVEFGAEFAPDFTISCPRCKKRTIDVSGRPKQMIKVRHKCPNCSNIVVTPILAKN